MRDGENKRVKSEDGASFGNRPLPRPRPSCALPPFVGLGLGLLGFCVVNARVGGKGMWWVLLGTDGVFADMGLIVAGIVIAAIGLVWAMIGLIGNAIRQKRGLVIVAIVGLVTCVACLVWGLISYNQYLPMVKIAQEVRREIEASSSQPAGTQPSAPSTQPATSGAATPASQPRGIDLHATGQGRSVDPEAMRSHLLVVKEYDTREYRFACQEHEFADVRSLLHYLSQLPNEELKWGILLQEGKVAWADDPIPPLADFCVEQNRYLVENLCLSAWSGQPTGRILVEPSDAWKLWLHKEASSSTARPGAMSEVK